MSFATTENVAVRLGRPLTAAEEAMSQQVIDDVTGLIAEACGKDSDWITDLDPVPTSFRVLCVEKALAVGGNPNQLRSHSQVLGARQDSRTFRDGDGVFLTDEEQRMVRAIVNAGAGSAWVEVGSILDTLPQGYLDWTGLPSWVVTVPSDPDSD